MSDVLGSVMSGLGGVGDAVGGGLNAIGSEAMALPGQIGSLFGGNAGAGAMNGTPGAVGAASVAPAGTAGGAMPAIPGISAGSGAGLGLADAGGLPQVAGAANDPVSNLLYPVTPPNPSAVDTSGIGPTAALAQPGASAGLSPQAASMNAAAGGGLTNPTAGVTTHQGPMQSLLSSLMTPKGAALGIDAGLLAKNLFSGDPSQLKALKQMATQDQQQAQQLGAASTAEKLGQLPQPAQDIIDRNTQQRIAQIRDQYARAGMSGSSAEAADIAAAKQDAVGQQFAIGQNLASQGIQEMQYDETQSSQLLQKILATEAAQGTDLGNLLSKFASLVVQ